jgi:hypothetical protein
MGMELIPIKKWRIIMKKQLLFLALALSTIGPVLSKEKHNKVGEKVFEFITRKGITPLSQADQTEFTRMIERVKKYHPEQLNGYYPYGGIQMTPLMLAAYYVNPDMVSLLLKNGADASLQSQGQLQTPVANFISLQLPGEQDPLKTQLQNLKNPPSIFMQGNQVKTTPDLVNTPLYKTIKLLSPGQTEEQITEMLVVGAMLG